MADSKIPPYVVSITTACRPGGGGPASGAHGVPADHVQKAGGALLRDGSAGRRGWRHAGSEVKKTGDIHRGGGNDVLVLPWCSIMYHERMRVPCAESFVLVCRIFSSCVKTGMHGAVSRGVGRGRWHQAKVLGNRYCGDYNLCSVW